MSPGRIQVLIAGGFQGISDIYQKLGDSARVLMNLDFGQGSKI